MIQNFKRFIRCCWIGYNQAIKKVTQWISILDAGYLYWHYYKRNLLAVSHYARGLLLDVGCGNRGYANVFSSNVKKYIGLDYPSVRKIHLSDDFNPPDVWGDAHFLPIKSASVDTVVSLQVLEHLPEPDKAIAEMYRLLKDEGNIILTTHGLYPIHGSPYDYYRYTEYGLTYLLEKYGFQVIKILRNGSYWAYMGLMLNNYFFYHFFEQRKQYIVKLVLGALKVLLTPVLIIIGACINALFFALDKTHDTNVFTSNYTVIAKKIG